MELKFETVNNWKFIPHIPHTMIKQRLSTKYHYQIS